MEGTPKASSVDWFKGKITGTSNISWENLWFPADFPLSQPVDIYVLVGILQRLGSYGTPMTSKPAVGISRTGHG